MANTRRCLQLKRRISVIEASFLPVIRTTGNYTDREKDDIRAYLLLTHAEIESYFEEVSEHKAKAAFSVWRSARKKSHILLSLVSFYGSGGSDKELDIEKRINKALSSFIYSLRQNHGIKEDNILSILLPIGLERGQIDTTWLNTITSFGSMRGEIAHTAAKVQQPLDPVTLKNNVQQILSEIQVLDEMLRKLS